MQQTPTKPIVVVAVVEVEVEIEGEVEAVVVLAVAVVVVVVVVVMEGLVLVAVVASTTRECHSNHEEAPPKSRKKATQSRERGTLLPQKTTQSR